MNHESYPKLTFLKYGFYRPSRALILPRPAPDAPAGLVFGRSRLDVAGQVLECNGVRQSLTFRETKLLRLFASVASG